MVEDKESFNNSESQGTYGRASAAATTTNQAIKRLNGEEDAQDEEHDNVSETIAGNVDRYWPPPIEHTVKFVASHSGKTISALAFNNEGTRFAAGGHDHEVKIWDFEALVPGSRLMPIASVQPSGGAVVRHLDFSPDDQWLLVISASCQALVMAKDGIVDAKEGICAKGDQYISDMAHTKGHVQMLNDGCWRPTDGNEFLTCSNDATLRLWDPIRLDKHKSVIRTRSPVSGLKTVAHVCRYSRDALIIAAGCQDGCVMMWDTRRKFISTSSCIRQAHLKGSEFTGLAFAQDANRLCTRSEDQTCKIWDLRQLKVALATRAGLDTTYPTTDCCFSPDDKFVITGTSARGGELHFMDSADLATKHLVDLEAGDCASSGSTNSSGASVVRVRWHPKINHLAYTSSHGQVCVTYDSRRSSGGGFVPSEAAGGGGAVQQQRGRKKRKNSAIAFTSNAALSRLSSGCGGGGGGVPGAAIKKIITPHALPLFRDDSRAASATASRMRCDPKRAYKPELPASARQQGGHMRPAGSTLSSYIARNIAKPIDDESVSIRDRILRHADEAERAPFWIKPSAAATAAAPSAQANQSSAAAATTAKAAATAAAAAASNKQKQEKHKQN